MAEVLVDVTVPDTTINTLALNVSLKFNRVRRHHMHVMLESVIIRSTYDRMFTGSNLPMSKLLRLLEHFNRPDLFTSALGACIISRYVEFTFVSITFANKFDDS